MSLKLLILLLPMAYARIRVEVRASSSEGQSTVSTMGSNVDVISDQEVRSFGLTDALLKDAVQRFSGGRPTDAFLKSPTPWNDLYLRYNWAQVQRTLIPRNARILGIQSEPIILNAQEFINNSSVTAKYNAGITQQVEDTVTSSWSTGGELTVGQEISYSIDVAFGEVGGTTSLSYTSSWGRETSKSRSVTVGSNSGVEVELAPGQAVVASLEASRGTMDIQVDYQASLDGNVACNYANGFRGHHFWRYDLNAVQAASSMTRTLDSSEVIRIGFFSDARVIVNDKQSRVMLATFNVGIVE